MTRQNPLPHREEQEVEIAPGIFFWHPREAISLDSLVAKVNKIMDAAIAERRKADERGSILIEAAISISLFLLLIMGGLDLTFACGARNDVHALVAQGVACAQADGCDVFNLIAGNAAQLGLDPTQLAINYNGRTVNVQYSYRPMGPIFTDPIVMTAAASKP